MTTTDAAPVRPATLAQALARPRFLLTPWPWRALSHCVATGAISLAVIMVAAPVYLPWALVLGKLASAPWDTVEIGAPATAGFLVGLAMVAGVSPLIALPLGALERRRLSLVSVGPFTSGHRTPPPGLWGWVRTRYTESATWREVAYLFLLMPIGLLMVNVLTGTAVLGAVMALAPLLVEDTSEAAVSFGFYTATTVEQALPLALLSPLVLVVLLYAAGILAQGHALVARALLVGPPKEELRAELSEVTESRARLVSAFEYERGRIERDLHDGAQQRLVALSMDLGLARLELEEDGEADRRVAAAQAKANDLIEELRQLVRGIHPRVLTDRGLPAALAELADHCPVPTRVDTEIAGRLPAHVEGTAYFVVAEALTNVYKHTEANAVTVHADTVRSESGETLHVEVTDYGAGGADPAKGSGLTGLKDRVAVMGGTMELSSPEGGPTRIRVELPCGPIPPMQG
ncbi:sensor histidine kinase [Nocardiopsis sp. NRRL B-16309]|uniref:sensor histidine kinase n=1 Tax=Nocardiopsis sp. NRRL B-16309 TaxID=1519494 RepID=UPI0006AF60B6|nr:sensor histidine kinase [Nocardiopsis sp. NRRL B-16309]KOX15517.1 histidine kinase [Nocardiopsis sp. NRRL B-16309]